MFHFSLGAEVQIHLDDRSFGAVITYKSKYIIIKQKVTERSLHEGRKMEEMRT